VLRPADNPPLVRQRPGDVLGEAASPTGEPRSATVLARVPRDVVELHLRRWRSFPSASGAGSAPRWFAPH
jgi:hypothetical protein